MRPTKEKTVDAIKHLIELSDSLPQELRTKQARHIIFLEEFLKDYLLSLPTQESVDRDRNRRRTKAK